MTSHSSDSNRVYLFDTTLRDGAQTQGVDFSVADKHAIAHALDAIGVNYVEGGWPGANPTDDAFFARPPQLGHATFTAFGMTRRPGRSVENDPGLAAVLDAGSAAVCLVGKSWDFHVDVALGIDRDENVAMIRDSVARVAARGAEAMFDAEHFFAGYQANPDYALDCIMAAYEAGARWVVLCDTNGGTLPDAVERIVSEVAARIPGERLGIHCHNDTGNAVANSLAALRAGARQVQGTINGLGERCGNADLISLIANLKLKTDFDIGVSDEQLTQLTPLSRLLDERLNTHPNPGSPYVGDRAFAHKGGLHVSAVEKDPRTYEHVPPTCVGNQRVIVVSEQAGRSNVLARLRDAGIEVDGKDPRLESLLAEVKRYEFTGATFDGADASFELLARRTLHGMADYFELERFRVIDEQRFNARGSLVQESEATVQLQVGGEETRQVAVGNGPVNALDTAIRAGLAPHYPQLSEVRLVDYKVRIFTPPAGTGTDAVTRVMIEFAGPNIGRWTTVGVSANIIAASVAALQDGYRYKLLKTGSVAKT